MVGISTHARASSAERFKQEVVLVVVGAIVSAIGEKVVARFEGTDVHSLSKALAQFEESRPKVIARVAEAIADATVESKGE